MKHSHNMEKGGGAGGSPNEQELVGGITAALNSRPQKYYSHTLPPMVTDHLSSISEMI